MANTDYYAILGVARTAQPREIRRAYRALARKFHPDLHPEDPAAAQKFRDLQEAYDVLSDLRKRKAYDYYGVDFGQRIPHGSSGPAKPQSATPRPGPSDFAPYASRRTGTIGPFPTSWGSGRIPFLSYRIGSLAMAGVFVIGTFVYLLWPDSGAREFRRAREALRHVQSVKIQVTDSGGGDYLDEISCPASGRQTQHVHWVANGQTIAWTLVTVTVHGDNYRYDDRSNRWSHDQVGSSRARGLCSRLSRGEDADPYFPFGKWLGGMYFIEKGALQKMPDGACREWKIKEPVAPGSMPAAYSVCLGVKTHLPMFEGGPNAPNDVRFYDWNVPIDVQLPAVATKSQ